jgi:Right handed beta helix region
MPILHTGTAKVGLLKLSRALVPMLLLIAVAAGCTLPPIVNGPGSPGARVPTVDATGVTDVSDQMAAFIRSVPNGSTISLVTNGRYRMEKTLVIDSRRDLTIEGNGATFFLTTPGDTNRSNVRFHYSSGITIRNLNIVGSNPLAGAKDRVYRADKGGQHGFDLESSSNIKLLGVSVSDVYGDFVYMGRGGNEPYTTDVTVQGGSFNRSGRQGITLTAAKNVLIETSTINEAKRSSFDFEPWGGANSTVDNVTIRNNRVTSGGLLFVSAAGMGSISNVTVTGNTLTNMPMTVQMQNLDGTYNRNWTVTNNTADIPSGSPVYATMLFRRITGLTVTGNVQPMKPGRGMYLVWVENSCGMNVSGNTLAASIGQMLTSGTC